MAQGPGPGGPGGPGRLLRSLRDIMAAPGSAQERLDRVVRLIAADFVAEVCSFYVRRAGDVLELFASEGLRREAVHLTRLRIGEGLVGEVAAHARPLALADAQAHPAFVLRPETGEEIYHSLVGVPVLRGGRVLGVLVVQNRARRQYQDEEVETLQTVAMVLAEVVAGGEIVDPEELLPADGIGILPLRLEGVALNDGLAMGRVVLHRAPVVVETVVADDPEAEMVRLDAAMRGMHRALDELLAGHDSEDGESEAEHVEVLRTYRMFAGDRGWLRRIGEAVRDGLTAGAAVQRVHEDMRTRLADAPDPYLRERMLDFEDLSNRLLQHLAGAGRAPAPEDLPADAILVARSLGPAELFEYQHSRIRALVLEEGSPTSHVAIVARAMDLPVVGRIDGLLDSVEPGDPLIVDGDNAQVFLRPGEELRQTFRESMQGLLRRREAWAALRDLPATTVDGVTVALHLNAGLLIDMQGLDETGADGIGLYRTEIPFMARAAYPDLVDQTRLYDRVLDQAAGRPVIFRVLDIGGDKPLPYVERSVDENPAMGWRGMRLLLDRPAMLRQQLRALLRAAGTRDLAIMFPMVSEADEFFRARELLEAELDRARSRRPDTLPVVRTGVMLEVPALIWQLPVLLPHLDFLSVGSNDLLQFLFASDRGSPRLADRFDPLSPAVFACLGQIVRACDEARVPVTLCGELAGRPLEAMALIGVGFRSLSMAAPRIGPVKAMIRSLDLAALSGLMAGFDALPDRSLRGRLRGFAVDHGVAVRD